MGRGRRLKSYLDYENALGDGIGVGYGQSYQPWLRAQDVKSRGNRSIVFGLKTFRNHHLLSSVEIIFIRPVSSIGYDKSTFIIFNPIIACNNIIASCASTPKIDEIIARSPTMG